METVESLVAKGRLKRAIALALKNDPSNPDLIALAGREAQLQARILAGTITNENALIEQNSIRAALVGFVG